MKKLNYILGIIFSVFISVIALQSCTTSKAVITGKSGAQLWGENCVRCHNSPSPVDFTDEEWKTIGLHMQVRANLTKEETEKIIEFLSSAN
ncbi:MAG: cytochrome c [Bacteroidota bacterium]|nr:cytochrome c [Bacteroidota bacterium]